MDNSKRKENKSLEKEMHMKVEEIDNKLASIKSDTQSLNRIFSLLNSNILKDVLSNLINKSEVKAAILYLTKDTINAKELSNKLGIDPRNLSKLLNPFLDKGFITPRNVGNGRERYYKRAELVDLIGYDRDEDYKILIDSWKKRRETKQINIEEGSGDSAVDH